MIWIVITMMAIIFGLLLLVIYLLNLLEKITYGTIDAGRNIVTPNNGRPQKRMIFKEVSKEKNS